MKTVNQISKLLGVSRQSIYKKIDNLGDSFSRHKNVSKNTLRIDDEGIELLKNTFKKPVNQDCQVDSKATVNQQRQVDNEVIEVLKNQRDQLVNQLTEKDKQIESLLSKVENMQILLRNEQEKNKLLLEDSNNRKEKNIHIEAENKKQWWRFWSEK